MNDFRAWLISLGLRPGVIAPDGRWRRCPTDSKPRKRNGAYRLQPDGLVGWAQDHETMDSVVTWRPENADAAPEFDLEKFKRAKAEAAAALEAASRAAWEFYNACPPLLNGHAYLQAHGLDMTGCRGLKLDPDGWLVVPAFRGRRLSSLQRISPEGDKRFWSGASVSGTSYTIDRSGATVTVLCEGLATGLACYAALPTSRVIVAWNTGNLARTHERPSGLVVVAADNDHGTEARTGSNPGIEAARKAAAEIGCGVAFPTGIRGTDWADFRQERLADLLQRRLPHETENQLRRNVDAEIGRALMRQARFVAPGRARG